MMKKARYFQSLENQSLSCQLCPRLCHLKPGEQGFCQNRENQGGVMYLNSYGKASGFQLDPIEKKPLNHFFPGSGVYSFGTIGCNLGCKFCQNWEISKVDQWDSFARSADPADIAQAAKTAGATSVAMTYNDPVIYIEFVTDVAQACKEAGLKVVLVSAGYINEEPRSELFAQVDAVNIDLKAFDESFYKTLCQGHLEPVKETLVYLAKETNVWTEITCLIIEGKNDSPQEIETLSRWIAEELGPQVPLHLSAFHPDHKMQDHPKTGLSTLIQTRHLAQSAGLQFVYTGNVYHPDGDTTFCPTCHQPVIERDWYKIISNQLGVGGFCKHCGGTVAGVFG